MAQPCPKISNMIYLDHAGTTPLDNSILNKMMPYLTDVFGNAQSQHSFGIKASNAVRDARDRVAKSLGAKAEEVFFTSGGTEADNWAVKGLALANADKGKHVIVSAIEHPAVIESAVWLESQGFEITWLNPDNHGIVAPQSVKNAIKEQTSLVCIMHANNETGTIQPVQEISSICKESGVLFFCDCVQSVGVLPVDLSLFDAISISSHKLYGPKGVGALWLKKGVKIDKLIAGGHQERAMRAGTTNVAGVVGFAYALENAVQNMQENNAKIKALRDEFVATVLAEIDGVVLNGDAKNRVPSNANLSFLGADGENVLFALDMRGIAVSTGSACSSGAVKASPVLKAMGLDDERTSSAVRFSFGKNNTKEEVYVVVNALKQTLSTIRKK